VLLYAALKKSQYLNREGNFFLRMMKACQARMLSSTMRRIDEFVEKIIILEARDTILIPALKFSDASIHAMELLIERIGGLVLGPRVRSSNEFIFQNGPLIKLHITLHESDHFCSCIFSDHGKQSVCYLEDITEVGTILREFKSGSLSTTRSPWDWFSMND